MYSNPFDFLFFHRALACISLTFSKSHYMLTLLRFFYNLWSSCFNELIVIFTKLCIKIFVIMMIFIWTICRHLKFHLVGCLVLYSMIKMKFSYKKKSHLLYIKALRVGYDLMTWGYSWEKLARHDHRPEIDTKLNEFGCRFLTCLIKWG